MMLSSLIALSAMCWGERHDDGLIIVSYIYVQPEGWKEEMGKEIEWGHACMYPTCLR